MKIDHAAIKHWIESEPTIVDKIHGFFCYHRHNTRLIPDLANLTFGQLITSLVRLALIIVIAGFPVWYELATTGAIQSKVAVYSVLALSAFLYVAWLIDHRLRSGRARDSWQIEERKLAGNLSAVIESFDKHSRQYANAQARMQRSNSIPKALKCIEHRFAQLIDHTADEYFSVTLLLFNENSGQPKAVIHERSKNLPDRPCGAVVNAEKSVAYHAAKYGRLIKIDNNFPANKLFLQERLSSAVAPPYRSILTISLPFEALNGKKICRGAITIDSARPYEFWRLDERNLLILLDPFIHTLKLLVSDLAEGVEVCQ